MRAEEIVGAIGIEGSGAFDAVAFWIGRTGGFSNDELGENGYKVRECGLRANTLEQDARSSDAHLIERLANCGEARIVERGALDVVETDD